MKWWGWLIIAVVVGGGLTLGAYQLYKVKTGNSVVPTTSTNPTDQASQAVRAGKSLTNNSCSGTGAGTLVHMPMDEKDYTHIIPYGLMVGGHVTPIDHQYFAPADYHSAKNAYPVYAMADAKLVDTEGIDDSRKDIRLVFSMSCTFMYYYDLLNSVEPGIKNGVEVKAGQLIGHIGGQTLDFAVWDTTKPLKNFIVPEHYTAESWKIYTADPLNYYTPELKALALAKYPRTVEPVSGRIDYDVDGKLIGTWFQQGTNGYAGADPNNKTSYWSGHLAIVPNNFDPSATIFSIGTWPGGEASQYLVKPGSTDPATVGIDTGLVKYDLSMLNFTAPDGTPWTQEKLVKDPKAVAGSSAGCALLQLTDTRLLKVETFPKQVCSAVPAFTSAAKLYER